MEKAGLGAAALAFLPGCVPSEQNKKFSISVAQWSLHKPLFANELTNLDFPRYTREELGLDGVEYVNQFFKEKAKDNAYLTELKNIASDEGVKNLLIMIDGEGGLGNTEESERVKAVENHYKWVEAAKFLGCHSIRVNAYGNGSKEEVSSQVVKSLGTLGEFASDYEINVIVENHGGYSSNGEWLAAVMEEVGMENVGTLPDFGNFTIDRKEGITYDRYKGVKEMMPYAKAVSAKCYDFEEGKETTIDYAKMMDIVLEAGYNGYVGIEYEGSRLSSKEGILACKALLESLQ